MIGSNCALTCYGTVYEIRPDTCAEAKVPRACLVQGGTYLDSKCPIHLEIERVSDNSNKQED